ncbi:MAG: hypothetical protein ACYDER_22835 [Ktedonobacteraceae bacterium]
MAITIFVLGRPGSGKSSAARRIRKLMLRSNCSVERINDYKILQSMSKRDFIRFRTIQCGGFDVIDWSVFDIALIEEQRVAESEASSADVIIIEFARSNYYDALKKFSEPFLQNAYFLFLDTEFDTCIHRIRCRIRHRVKNPSALDDNFVSENILHSYYKNQELSTKIIEDLGIDSTRLTIFNNNGSRSRFDKEISKYVNHIFERHPYLYYGNKVRKVVSKTLQKLRIREKFALPTAIGMKAKTFFFAF